MLTTPPGGRLISLSAGTVLDASPDEALRAATGAGFGGFGIRWDPSSLPLRSLPALRARIDGGGVVLVDVEVIRLSPEAPVGSHRAWVDAATVLGARFLLAVSTHPAPARTRDELAQLAEWCGRDGPQVALEFMRFTSVPTFRAAVDIVRATDSDRVCVLVDALHVQRGGEGPEDLRDGASLIGYLQLCDAPLCAPGADAAALAEEARHHRLFPGEGGLPLAALIAALPADLPCCVEVQSDHWAAVDPRERARYAMQTARTLLPAPA